MNAGPQPYLYEMVLNELNSPQIVNSRLLGACVRLQASFPRAGRIHQRLPQRCCSRHANIQYSIRWKLWTVGKLLDWWEPFTWEYRRLLIPKRCVKLLKYTNHNNECDIGFFSWGHSGLLLSGGQVPFCYLFLERVNNIIIQL